MDAIKFARFIIALKECEEACRLHKEDDKANEIANAIEYALQQIGD